MSLLAFVQTIVRVFLVWSAFYFVGFILEKPLKIKKILPLIPREITGILLFMLIAVILSLSGILNRTITPIIVILIGIPGMFVILPFAFRKLTSMPLSFYNILNASIFILILTISLTYASMPNLSFDDPLVTYAVQPDRWLNTGSIYWLEDTAFSGFPLTYEITAIWPASLSTDRIDQLSVLQVFQVTMLLVALYRGAQILVIRKKLRIPLATVVLSCSLIYYWCSLAKTDTEAILFCTLALSSIVREIKDRTIKPLTSWFFMGIALATKQTALLILVPFLIYGIFRMHNSSWRMRFAALCLISLLPLVFAIRTFIKTGSPTYPVYSISSIVKPQWKLLPIPEEIALLQDRSSEMHPESEYSVLKHIGIFLTSMEGILLLFLAGLFFAIFNKNISLFTFVPLLLYFATAILVFWPPWWGAKYAILVYPFTALLGTSVIQTRRTFATIFLPLTCIVSIVVPLFIVSPSASFPGLYRYTVTKSVLQGEWDTSHNYRMYPSSPEGMAHMWLNSYIKEPSVILSLHEEKRYFCDQPVYVGWRHPATQYLYLNNTLEDECQILDNLGVDYVLFYRIDPGLFNMENRLLILDHIGINDILEPIVIVSTNFLICKYNSPL